MVLALFVSGDVVVGVASVPAELVLLVGGDVDVLEVSVGLLVGGRLRLGHGPRERRAQGHSDQTDQELHGREDKTDTER